MGGGGGGGAKPSRTEKIRYIFSKMFHHLFAKGPKCCRNFGLQRGNGLKIPDAHPYPRLYRSTPPPEFLGIFQELVFGK